MRYQMSLFDDFIDFNQFSGNHVAITGRLPVPRAVAVSFLEEAGALYDGYVSKRTEILLVGDIKISRKLITAERRGVEIVRV